MVSTGDGDNDRETILISFISVSRLLPTTIDTVTNDGYKYKDRAMKAIDGNLQTNFRVKFPESAASDGKSMINLYLNSTFMISRVVLIHSLETQHAGSVKNFKTG